MGTHRFMSACPLQTTICATEDKSATDGKSSTWPNGEPKSVRDAADRKGGK